MTGPREWRHEQQCVDLNFMHGCTCGLSAVRDATAQGHRVVIGPDGVEGRLVDGDDDCNTHLQAEVPA